jgi:CRP/FNR family cyclic AMP-dependent transcriptional regulator
MQTLDELIEESPVFAGMDESFRTLVAGCGANVVFRPDEWLFREGGRADTFWLLRRGRVALQVHVPGRGDLTFETIEPGDVVGWSWLFPPYEWQYDARAVDEVHAVVFDGECLRGKSEADHALGHELMRRFGKVIVDRLQHTRMRLIDVYGHHPRN